VLLLSATVGFSSSAVRDVNFLSEPTTGVLRLSPVHMVVGFLLNITVGFLLFCYFFCQYLLVLCFFKKN